MSRGVPLTRLLPPSPRKRVEGRLGAGLAAADIPASSSRGPETFFDGKVFDPENPKAYLDSLSIKAGA